MNSALIIDDEADARSVLRKMLRIFYPNARTVEAKDAWQALNAASKEHFDLAFIDIQLKQDNGLKLAARLAKYCPNLIFVTAHDNYAAEAYHTKAIHYLLKPVNPLHLQEAINRADFSHNPQRVGPEKPLLLSTKSGVVILDQNEIDYIQGDGNYCTFYCKDDKKYVVSKYLAHYESLLDSSLFFRIHQSYLVNLQKVRQYLVKDGYFVVLKNEISLPLARRRKEEFLRRLS